MTKGFIADFMMKTGFRSVKSESIQTHIGIMEVDIARKQVR